MPGAMRDAELAAILRAPFAEQVAFFRQKLGNLVPTEKWDDLWQEQHDRAFMVAGAAKADLLADLAAAVDKAVADGETLQAFRKRFGEIVTRHGWAGWTGDDRTTDRPQGGKGVAWRTRVIYETNLITSYSAGRLAQLKDGGYEWWVYKHSDFVRRPRPHHVALDGVTKRADDPFWQTYSPPNGWGCRCRIVGARGPRDFTRYGGDPDKPLPEWVGKPNQKSTRGTPIGIDDGFAYQPGATVVDTVRALAQKLDRLPPAVAAGLREDIDATRNSAVKRAIDDVSRSAADDHDGIEYASLIGKDGKVVFGPKRGGKGFVEFSDDEMAMMDGGVLVHNHPSGQSLSLADLLLAATTGLKRIYAVANDQKSVYVARVIMRDLEGIRKAHMMANMDVRMKFRSMVRRGVISSLEAERWHWHAVNLLMARRGVMSYHARIDGATPEWVYRTVLQEATWGTR